MLSHHVVQRDVERAVVKGSVAEWLQYAPTARTRAKWLCWLKPAEPGVAPVAEDARTAPCAHEIHLVTQ